ncbi:hypothetical protein Leryth_002731 [Lithospermum erythrorhizon]|nr:hypothetical protein Leryth_002731 [Lithospermum erythrorhizon]
MDQKICMVHKPSPKCRGWFFGENPLTYPTSILLCQLSLCMLLTGFLHSLLNPIGESAFISQTGVILGPAFVGSSDGFKYSVFPVTSFYVCDTFAYFGLMLYMFLVGVKTDLTLIWKCGKRSVLIGALTFFMPFILNFVMSEVLLHTVALDASLHKSMHWIAALLALNSFHVIVCLLADLNLMNSVLGKVAVSASMISGTCSWIFVSIAFTAKQTLGEKTALAMGLLFVTISSTIIFVVLVMRPIVLWMARHTVDEESISSGYISVIFIMIMVCALTGEILGQHFLFGPMILGIAIPDGPPIGSALIKKLDCFVSTILLPLYFVISATRTDFQSIELRNVLVIGMMAVFAFLVKLTAVMLPALLCKMPVTDSLCLGLILSTQGITEVIIIQRANSLGCIDRQSYTILLLSIVLLTGTTSPIVKYLYKPFKSYMPYKKRTIQNLGPDPELRMLACIYYQDHTPSVINLLEASYPTIDDPICFYVVHLIDLAERAAARLEPHYLGKRNPDLCESERVVNAFRLYGQQNQGNVTLFPYTSISPFATMHEDVCQLALDKRVSMVIVPFHKLFSIGASENEVPAIRSVNQNIIRRAPCSVGILVDRDTSSSQAPSLFNTDLYTIGVIFLGGQDDREALAYASRMAKHPHVSITVVRFVGPDDGKLSKEKEKDSDIIKEVKYYCSKNERFIYEEEHIKNTVDLIGVMRKIENLFNLILVGRHHDSSSPLLMGLTEWNDFQELGSIGDMLGSTNSTCTVSVLVVQQHSFVDGASLNSPRTTVEQSYTSVDMPHDAHKVWPVEGKQTV